VFTFLVPKAVDPASVSFATNLPSTGLGLVKHTGDYFLLGGANTSSSGQVVGLPLDFDFGAGVGNWYPVTGTDGLIPTGASASWVGGVACADNAGVVTNLWAQDITFTVSTGDPKGFTWLAGPSSATTTSSSTTSTTTPGSTTSTTAPGGTTTSTTRPATTAGTVGGGGGSTSGGRTLALTGSDSRSLAMLGGLLLAIGVGLVLVSSPIVALEPLPWPDQR
jgi:hypothetical protein